MITSFLLLHSYEVSYYGKLFDETKIIGIYSSREKAEAVKKKYASIQGFDKYPVTCFYISEYTVDEDDWKEGFAGSDDTRDDFVALTTCCNNWLGIRKTAEESWEDDNYYNALNEISIKAYTSKNVEELSNYIKTIWNASLCDSQKNTEEFITLATNILAVLKLK